MNITWVITNKLVEKNGRYTSPLASARYRCLIPAYALIEVGYNINVVVIDKKENINIDNEINTADIVVFSKIFNDQCASVAEKAKALGKLIIIDFCDNPFSSNLEKKFVEKVLSMADMVTTATPQLATIVNQHTSACIEIIPDPIEGISYHPEFSPSVPLKLLWFGQPTNFDTLDQLLREISVSTMPISLDLHVISLDVNKNMGEIFDQYNAAQKGKINVHFSNWSIDSVWEALKNTDLVVIPSNDNESKLLKSNNRLTESLYAGKMVVAYPLPSYLEFIDTAVLTENILEGILWCVNNPQLTRERIEKGQKYVADNFNPKKIGQQWESIFLNLIKNTPRTSIQAEVSSKKLNLGCGDKILPGYINIDVAESRKGKKPDILCDLHNLSMIESNSVDEVLSVHVIEHFWRWEVDDILNEWIRVLKPGGKLILECPNLISACEEFLKNPDVASGEGPEGQRTMWVFYGDPAWKDPLMNHRWGYTPNSLGKLMSNAGLCNIHQAPAEFKLREPRDMRIVGEKAVL